MFVPKVRYTTGPLISKIKTVQITVLLAFPPSQQRDALSESADTQSIVCIYFPVSSQNKLQFECFCFLFFFFILSTVSYHVTVVFVGQSRYQQVPMLNFTAARQPCIAWNPPITEKQKQAQYHPDR